MKLAWLAAALLVCAGCQRAHDSSTMATVNGKPILRPEVETIYQNNLGDSNQTPSAVQSDIMRLNILRQLIDEEILMQRAAKQNLTATDEEVADRLNELKAPFTKEEFQKRLDSQHLTLDDLKREIRRNQTEEKLFNKEITSRINITDGDISGYYNAHKAEFNLIEPQYHLSQIVVTSTPMPPRQVGNLQNSKAMSDADAKRKIEMLHNRLESGEDFSAMAMNFSEDSSTSGNGGDLGFKPESQLKSDPQVFAAISKLNPGQISDILPVYGGPNAKQPVGYAIYKLLDREAAGQRELNDPRVQQAIRQQLRDSREQLLKNAYLEMLRDQAHVENYYAEEVFKNGAQ
ncbi:MAG TPA: SurA N-terminal domain-containing protein [Acidobacteriaceae bacterium]|jgi:peptidyl-prolyl cis-trans isomerase SurA|nr:SurA N-terminal domain-containing protein [Acidobacteriaceae bacterium]